METRKVFGCQHFQQKSGNISNFAGLKTWGKLTEEHSKDR